MIKNDRRVLFQQDQHVVHSNKQEKKIESLNGEIEKVKKILENERLAMEKERV